MSTEPCEASAPVCGECFGGCHSFGKSPTESNSLSIGEPGNANAELNLRIVSCFCLSYLGPLIAMFAFALVGERAASLAAIPSVDAVSAGAGLLGFLFYLRIMARLPLTNGH